MTLINAEVAPEQERLNWGRLLMDGIPYADLTAALERGEDVSWFDHWMKTAADYEKEAQRAVDAGHRHTAGELFVTASLCAQYAQYLWFGEDRAAGQQRKVDLYLKAAPYLDPPAVRFDLPIDDVSVPGYLRVPDGKGPWPCAVLIGGLESTKEESYRFEELLLARGVAIATFDGPGQGEMLAGTAACGDFERYTSRVVDFLIEDSRLDANRLAVVGRSAGGHYALRSASLDSRFVACVSWGGYVNFENWEGRAPLAKESWRYVSKSANMDEARIFVEECLDVRPVLAELRVPTYFQQGALDFVPVSQVETLKKHAINADLTVVVEPAGDHCCHNLGPRPRLEMVDWVADQLRTGGSDQ
ncbi:alpha/beta hydrolase [Nocardioides sp. JQ2195]|uniref:alpha/beta hydrolase family protein n=1 Tax=Nocardioides sp. JQ2195 TaxID=2592334 RepID=UPI00143E1108|nr:alpha/beta hydrolase family protein [Nocardioides sp. JQ2195]QIX26961.1 alpha/beta hydrolase [Nocardioides sp. JQ2195]